MRKISPILPLFFIPSFLPSFCSPFLLLFLLPSPLSSYPSSLPSFLPPVLPPSHLLSLLPSSCLQSSLLWGALKGDPQPISNLLLQHNPEAWLNCPGSVWEASSQDPTLPISKTGIDPADSTSLPKVCSATQPQSKFSALPQFTTTRASF